MLRLLKEPLLHFTLAGAFLFGLYAFVAPEPATSGKIVVSPQHLEMLNVRFAKTWQRDPNPEELQALIDDYILDEVYYREALVMGIDENDPLIRRRLRQKMSFLVEDTLSLITPTEQQLHDYYASHTDHFRFEPRYSFRQIFVSHDQPSARFQARLNEIAVQLQHVEGLTAENITVAGDPTLLAPNYQKLSAFQVNRILGDGFSQKLDALPTGQWSNPLRSGLGTHFVFIDERVPGALPPFDSIRDQVRQQWAQEQRQDMTAEVNRQLLAKYQVVVERSGTTDG